MAPEARVHLLAEALQRAEADFRDGHPGEPLGHDDLPDRGRHFADAVRYAVRHPWGVRHLQSATGELAAATTPAALVPVVLQHGIELTGADLGDLQVVDPATGTLRMVAHSGFDDEFVRRFAVVDDRRTVCARAALRRTQVVVGDVTGDEDLVALGLGGSRPLFTAVQSTPLRDFAGRVVGVLSTHWRQATWSGVPDLRLLELYADYAGDRLALLLRRGLGPAGAGRPADEVGPVARAMLLALLDPPERPPDGEPDGVLLAGPMARAFPDDRLASFADLMVTGLFTTGLELDSARSTAREHHPADRVLAERLSSATRHLDRMLDEVRAFMVRHGEDPDEL